MIDRTRHRGKGLPIWKSLWMPVGMGAALFPAIVLPRPEWQRWIRLHLLKLKGQVEAPGEMS